MKLLSLKASNIFSIGYIELDLKNRGLLLVKGWSEDEKNENGAGKSSICNKSLCWGLYGKTVGGVKGDRVINRHTKGDTYVEIEFCAGAFKYRLRRTRSPANLSLFLLSDNGSEDISYKTEKQTQEVLDNITGRTFKTFIQTEFFGQGRPQSFFDLTPADQQATINSILPIERLADYEIQASTARKKVNEYRDKRLQRSIAQFNASIKTLEFNIGGAKTNSRSWEDNHTKSIRKLEKDIKFKEDSQANLEDDINILQIEIKNIEPVDSILKNITKLENEKEIKETELNKIYELRRQWSNYFENLNKDIQQLYNSLDDCQVCDQSVPKDKAKKIIEELEKKKEDFGPAGDSIILCDKQAGVLEEEITKINNEINLFKEEVKTSLTEEAKQTKIKNQIQKLREKDISAEIKWMEESLSKLKKEENPHFSTVLSFTTQLQETESKLALLKEEDLKWEKEEKDLTFWEKAFKSDIKTLLLERACPFLEERTNTYLKQLGNSQISAHFSADKTLASGDAKRQFNVTVRSDTGGAEYDLLSGGEQQMVKFAVGLALADLAQSQASGSSDFIVLDEPFENLSPKNSESVVAFLNSELSKRKSTIFLVTNEPHLQSIIPQSITVVKSKGVSYIEGYQST